MLRSWHLLPNRHTIINRKQSPYVTHPRRSYPDLKDDMIAFVEGHGMRRFHGYVDYEEVQA